MIIYKATNKINGKSYIGKTTGSLNKRIIGHKSSKKDNMVFHYALKKYGEENFEWSIIYKGNTEKELNEKEKFYIKEYKTKAPNGYNITDGGDGQSGINKPKSEKHKKNISISLKNKIKPEEHRKKISETMIKNGTTKGQNHPRSAKWIITTPQKETVIINCLSSFCQENNLIYSSMKSVGNGRMKQHKGYKCRK